MSNTISDTIFKPHFVYNTKHKTIFDFMKNPKQYPIVTNIWKEQYNIRYNILMEGLHPIKNKAMFGNK